MGLRFRKSINLGKGFRINLSKSGIGYSWGTKGFRTTKTATGKNRNTFSIPGTGISYVDEKGTSSYNHTSDNDDFENLDETNDNKKGGSVMKKILISVCGIILSLILLVYFPAGLIIGSIAAIIYFITHKQAFAEKSLLKKLGTSVLIFLLALFGIAGTFGESPDVQQDTASNEEPSINSTIDNNTSTPPDSSVPEPSETPVEENQPEETVTPAVTPEAPGEEAQKDVEQPAPVEQPSAAITPPVTTDTPSITEQPSETQSQSETVPPEVQAPAAEETSVYITDTGTKYHRAGCRFLDESQHETTLQNAISQGYEPCKVCNPPTE